MAGAACNPVPRRMTTLPLRLPPATNGRTLSVSAAPKSGTCAGTKEIENRTTRSLAAEMSSRSRPARSTSGPVRSRGMGDRQDHDDNVCWSIRALALKQLHLESRHAAHESGCHLSPAWGSRMRADNLTQFHGKQSPETGPSAFENVVKENQPMIRPMTSSPHCAVPRLTKLRARPWTSPQLSKPSVWPDFKPESVSLATTESRPMIVKSYLAPTYLLDNALSSTSPRCPLVRMAQSVGSNKAGSASSARVELEYREPRWHMRPAARAKTGVSSITSHPNFSAVTSASESEGMQTDKIECLPSQHTITSTAEAQKEFEAARLKSDAAPFETPRVRAELVEREALITLRLLR